MDFSKLQLDPEVFESEKTPSEEVIADRLPDADSADTSDSHTHHHHHSHHSHHRHRHHRSSKLRKVKRFYRKHKLLLGILLAVLILGLLTGAVFLVEYLTRHQTEPSDDFTALSGSNPQQINTEYLYVGIPVFSQKHFLVDTVVRQYMGSDTGVSIEEFTKSQEDVNARYDWSVPVKLQFDIHNLPDHTTLQTAQLELASTNEYYDNQFFDLSEDGTLLLYNLKTGCKYHYRLHLTLSDGSQSSFSGSFETAESPRILSIDGVHNVRDMGGWKTRDGKTIRQGLLFRGSELDGAVESSYKITSQGINQLLMNLGVKTDMDLRSVYDTAPGIYVLGSNVNHYNYAASDYEGIFTPEGQVAIRAIFADLAKAENYPVYLHCTYGVDRTGTVCYLLEALLGVSDEDLMRDYELSGLCYRELNRANLRKLEEGLKDYPGANTQERTEAYLLSIGVTEAEIDSIRSIFLD